MTSPPYFGLRDYGTGSWEGGDPSCDHARPTTNMNVGFNERWGQGAGQRKQETKSSGQYARSCPRCGARRVDRQIGLEASPAEYVAALVDVFAELRRVLAPHGTAWLNLGDSYTSGGRDWYDGGDQVNGAARGHASRPATPAGLKPKELVGIPWRVALALQDAGWWLRSEVIWAKPNCMPESVRDRPTKAHEHVFLLTKARRYWFDQDAVREPAAESTAADPRVPESFPARQGSGNAAEFGHRGRPLPTPAGGRNLRTVWEIPTGNFDGAHFAVMPTELARRCVLAGAAREVCRECGRPRERVADRRLIADYETVGWTDCGHGDYRRGLVLDPFLGAGTTAVAAMREGRDAVGVELSPEYAAIAERRLARWWDDAAPAAGPPPLDGQLSLA